METGNKVTINDVADAAGVSKGTVDRVLHNRGEVSKKSREKVLRVIKELGYIPNLQASLLASQKHRVIVCMFPEYEPGEFWSLTDKGVNEAAAIVARFGIALKTVKYDQYSIESFRSACAEVLAERPSGVILAPMYRFETVNFVGELSRSGIPYMFIDSKIDDDGYLAYFGMPMYHSGVLCADVLTDGREVPGKVFVVRIARDKRGLSDPTAARRAGFMDYMTEHYPDIEVVNIFIDPKDRDSIYRILDETIGEYPGRKFIVMFNSRIHLVADYLASRGMSGCRVVGFDGLERNISALKRGEVQVLIAQHTDRQTVEAINAMTDYLLMGKEVPRKDNFTQMDLLTGYNCDFY